MKFAISNAQKNLRITSADLRRFAIWLSKNIPEFHAAEWDVVSIVVTDDAGIAEINEQFLKHRGPTDVITFMLPPPPGDEKLRGEIYVNAERAALEAKRRRIEPARELAFYIAHGFDHLAGFDDRTPAMRARMHLRERACLRKFGKRDGRKRHEKAQGRGLF